MSYIKRRKKLLGKPPGTPIFVGDLKSEKITINKIEYNKDEVVESTIIDIKNELVPSDDQNHITWINTNGVHDPKIINEITKKFKIHSLILEDIVNTDQRIKIEEFEEQLYIVVKTYDLDFINESINSNQISIILGKNSVLTFQETDNDELDFVKNRIIMNKGAIRKLGSDYLVFAILDVIFDKYFVVIDQIDKEIEDLDDLIITNPTIDTLSKIQIMKKIILKFRRQMLSLRDMVRFMERLESIYFDKKTVYYLRSLYDHVIQITDNIEMQRETLLSLQELYMSSISNKTNDVMKILTIITSIFIPLSFLAGIYGMNFKHMPELAQKWGYPILLTIMLIIASSLLLYFKKKDWV